MQNTYIKSLKFLSQQKEDEFFRDLQRTRYGSVYPYKIFVPKGIKQIDFAPITIFYGGNGSGKSTMLNIIAEKTKLIRHSAFGGSAFFIKYVKDCEIKKQKIPEHSQILTSDDVSDYLLNIRYLNEGIDVRREDLFSEYLQRKYSENRFTSLEDYDRWKEGYDAKSKTQSRFVKERLMRNVDMYSNGESAMRFWVERITENALYLLDEPENSLSVSLQQELCKYILDSSRYFGCQFVIATHSPIFLSMADALIYDLDEFPVCTKKWTELENVRKYFDFFEKHREEFF